MTLLNIATFKKVQHICKNVMLEISPHIRPGMSETDIVTVCQALIRANGIQEYWYHNVPVIVTIGNRTTLSMSGKDYSPSNQIINDDDFVTVDLSLAIDNHWGIYAKSFTLGSDYNNANKLKEISKELHQTVLDNVYPGMLCCDLHDIIEQRIIAYDIEHLDFRSNFGHTIETNLDDRVFIDKTSTARLDKNGLFSFEPHLKFKQGSIGFKEADIYYFEADKVYRLSETC